MEKTIGDLKQNGLAAVADSAREARKAVEALRAIVDEAEGSEVDQEELVKDEFTTPLAPGDDIEVLPSGLAGTLLEIVGNRAKVAVGSIRTELPISRIRRARAKKKETRSLPEATRQSEIGRQMAQNISVELDLRGMKVDEAFEAPR